MYTFTFDFETRARGYKVPPIGVGAALLKDGVPVETVVSKAYRPSMEMDKKTKSFWDVPANKKALGAITVDEDDKRSDEQLAVDMVVAVLCLRHKGELMAKADRALFYEWQDTTFDVVLMDYLIASHGEAILKALPDSISAGLPDGVQPYRYSTVDDSFGHAHDMSSCL